MSRFNPHHDTAERLELAQRWKEDCLLNGGSLFTDRSIWQREYIQELVEHFVENPDEGDGSFLEKLEQQLSDVSENAKILAAEILYIMLFCPSNISPEKKRENVNFILGWTGINELDENHPLFTDDILMGFGSGGTGFNNYRWREAVYFILMLQAFSALTAQEKSQLLDNGWKFAQWLEDIPDNEKRQLRHMLLHILFPDDFERTFGGQDRTDILTAFQNKKKKEVRGYSALEVDKALFEIRENAAAEYGTEELDFYLSPLKDRWKDKAIANWLFVWNPGNWQWEDLPATIEACRKGETVTLPWSCANKKVAIGDKAWLMRVGQPPKGIFAIGTVVTEPYEAPHYDEDKAEEGITRTCVDIEFTQILDVFSNQIITEQDLSRITIDNQNWLPQSSGIEIKDRSAGLLEKLWDTLLAGTAKPSASESRSSRQAINEIFYGPPGTGKTYRLGKIKDKYISSTSKISREQWLSEELLSEPWFNIVYMSLYALGGQAKVTQILSHELIIQKAIALGRTENIRQQIWASLQAHAANDSSTVKYERRTPPLVFDKKADSSWFLTEGHEDECSELIQRFNHLQAGPGSESESSRFEFVTFHQAYSYEDFVEGIRPVQQELSEDITYQVVPGVFRRICQRARQDPDHRYAIMIDEINRGNIAKIFGELITLIELDKREGAENTIRVTLPYSGEKFSVPGNLDIYGTMNTADRSIALLDTALRRRFQFTELMPDPSLLTGSRGDGYIEDGEGGLINLRELLRVMNQRIKFLLGRDLMLGHAYFHKVRNFEELRRVFVDQIIPLMQEYFYSDWHRIQLVFKDISPDGSRQENQIIESKEVSQEELFGLSDDDLGNQMDYQVARRDDIHPDSIRKIYEST